MAKQGERQTVEGRPGAKGDPAREARLAAALRANLKRRKLAGRPAGADGAKAKGGDGS
jgi:hypothetical protein